MTTPVTDPEYTQRLKVAGQAAGANNPQLAYTLAQSGLTATQMQQIGGFAQALQTNTANQLAADSGVQTNYTTTEQNHLDSLGTQPANPPPAPDNRNWFEKALDAVGTGIADGGNFIFHNPVTHAVMSGLNWIGNAAKMPWRLVSAGVGGVDTQARNAEMLAQHYDPSSTTSQLAFMFNHDDSEYHSLSHVRDQYGDDLVNLAVQQQADPEGFQKQLENMDPTQAAGTMQKLNSEEFKQASAAVDALHISPGRDLANIVLSPFGVHDRDVGANNAGAKLFSFLSGSLDAAYTWFADPTIILGKVSAGIRAADALGRVSEDMNLTTKLMTRIAGANPTGFVASRARGIADVLDRDGIYKTLGFDPVTGVKVTDTKLGQAWQTFLDRAAQMRDLTKTVDDVDLPDEVRHAAEIQRAQLYAQIDSVHRQLMPLLPEINGTRVLAPKTLEFDTKGALKVEQPELAAASATQTADHGAVGVLTKAEPQTVTEAATEGYEHTINSRLAGGWLATNGKPITDLKDLADYLSSTGGLLRLAGGEAAQAAVVMPGKLSFWAERMAARKANSTEKWINYTDTKFSKLVPVDEENDALNALDSAGADLNKRAQLGDLQHNLLRSGTADGQGFNLFARARARAERVNRRLTTVLPTVKHFDLTDPSTVKDVERFARFYLNKGDSRLLAAAYASGDLAARRAVVRGMLHQSFHAAGLSRTPAGQKFMDQYLLDVDKQLYGLEGTDVVQTADRGLVHGALYNSQLSTTVPMPSLKQMNQMAVRFAVDSWASKMGLTAGMGAIQSNRMDALYGHIKMGWITSAAGGVRNALDELVGFMGKGMFSQFVRGRQAYTQAMAENRANRLAASRDYMAKAKAEGRISANDYVATRNYEADKGVEQATRDLENAKKAQELRDQLPDRLQARYDEAHAAYKYHEDAHFQAATDLRAAQRSSMPVDTARIPDLQARYDETLANVDKASAARGKAKMALTKLPEQRAKLEAGLAKRGWDIEIPDAEAGLRDALEEHKQARLLENAIHYKIPYFLRRAGDTVNDVLFGATASKLLRVLGPRWAPTADQVEYVKELGNEELRGILADGIQQTHFGSMYGALAGPDAAMELHREGLMARRYAFTPAGWGTIEPDGGQGLDSFAKYIALRFSDPTEASHAWVQAYQHTHDLQAARDSVRGYLDDPAMRHFMANAEVMRTLKDGTRVTTPALLAQAKDELADRISADLIHGLMRDGKVNDNLLNQLAQAHEIGVPDASWLSHNVPVDERPEQTIGQLWAVHNPLHQPGKFPRGYTAMMSKSYQKVVTDQIDALSRNPLLAALYVNARKNIQPWEQHLIEAGWDPEVAKQTAMTMSLRHATQEAYKHVDNPWVSSQFSLISRNFVNFERAQEDWLRRWARAIKDNPSIIRKAQLTLHAGTATGMVEQDPTTNNLMFVYPGSQLAMRVFNSAMHAIGLGDKVQLPIVQELTSQLTFLSPSLQQPFGVTASPLLTLPFKALASTVGQDHQLLMNTLDRAMNGTLGSGRSWYEQILPPTINRILRGVVQSDPGSQYGQAYANGTMALAAAGYFDKLDGTDPTAISNAQDALASQTRNNMVLNALFGFFAPATPEQAYATGGTIGTGSANTAGHQGTTPDWSAHLLGYQSLKQEAQQALTDLGPTRFRLWWAAVHPNELIWDPTAGTSSHTKTGANNAYLPTTLFAAKWMEDNQAFLARYGGAGGIGTYFVPSQQNITGYDEQGNPVIGPTDPAGGAFNDVAYRAQLQDHMRDLKPLNELLPNIIIQRGEAEYYAAKDQADAAIAQASASGNNYQAKQLEDQWSQDKQDIYARNPLLAQKNASYATNGSEQQVAISNLKRLVDDPSSTTAQAIGPLRDGVQQLLDAYEMYQAGDTALSGRRGNFATQQRSLLVQTYQADVQAVAQQYPDLADLVRGVFRTP